MAHEELQKQADDNVASYIDRAREVLKLEIDGKLNNVQELVGVTTLLIEVAKMIQNEQCHLTITKQS